ncbi:hypothetical protein SAMN05660690_1418 [Geodermatophilus telluris]|uniref:Phosphodiesterase n=1 Tax=Geodermatophilus telluris TaxID=1190417 RepID=A0A1G6LJ24_9ACTN|nr:hypothetical protein [Geodermatophilus telluris]SDC43280.1 hypothetical protein SAMN05660690_1418 [Geodermatophilus telluris]
MDLLAIPRALTSTTLALGTALRGSRVVHPRGRACAARVVADGDGAWGARVLDEAGTHDVVVRVSRGAGLPRPLPDVLGLAVRFPGRGRDGGPLDVLVNTAGSAPGLRHVFLPHPLGRTYSSVLPHRTGTGRLVVLGARADDSGTGWELLAAPLTGGWTRWGRLTLGAELPATEAERLRFRPTLGADDLRPVAFLREVRDRSYRESQALRR